MTFRIDVHVTGLCMFVVPSDRTRPTHLLLPETASRCATGSNVPQHTPVLEYKDPAAPPPKPGEHPATIQHAMERRYVDLGGLCPPVANATYPDDLFDMRSIVSEPLRPDALSSRPPEEIAGRITLPGGCVRGFVEGAQWKIGGKKPKMCFAVFWRSGEIEGTELTLTLRGMDDDSEQTITIAPDDDGIVRLYVTHLPTNPEEAHAHHAGAHHADDGSHFNAYYCPFAGVNKFEAPTSPLKPTGGFKVRDGCTGEFAEVDKSTREWLEIAGTVSIRGVDYRCMQTRVTE